MKISQHKQFFLSTLLFFCFLTNYAQNITIEGSVVDEDDVLIGATIQLGTKGTSTDLNGNFKIDVPKGRYDLIISYVGYGDFSQSIEAQESINLGKIELIPTANILETATVTSGKFEKALGEVTVSVEVVKPKLLEAINATSVGDVLDKIPGVNIIDGQANIRGGSGWSYGAGSRVLLLVDDIPALQADAGFPNWRDLPVENIEQIEVVKGAASALYGSSALNGIINVRTAYAKSEPVTKFSTFFLTFLEPKNEVQKWWNGSNFPYRTGLSFSHRQKIDKFDVVVGGFGQYNRGLTKDTYNRFGRINTSIRYRLNERLSFGANTNFNYGRSKSFFYWENSQEGAYLGGDISGDASTNAQSNKLRYFIDPFLTYFDKKGNQHKIMSRFYSVKNDNNNNQSNRSDLFYAEYQFQHKFLDQNLVLTTGASGMKSFVSAELYGDTTHTTSNVATYVQLDKKLFNKLNLSLGARYEYNNINSPGNETSEAKPVIRIGANYQLGKATFLRSSFGQGYRFPTIAERSIQTQANGIQILPNPDLGSETGWTTEVGLKQGLKLGSWQGFVDLSAFWSEYQDMMEFTFYSELGFGFRSENIGNTRIRGYEISIGGQGKIGDVNMNLIAGYNYIDPKYKDFGEKEQLGSTVDYNILKYRYQHSAKLDVEWGWKKVFLGTTVVYNSHMEAVDRILDFFLPDVNQFRSENENGWVAWDFRTGYDFNEGIRFAFMMKNILNKAYMVRPGKIEAPRNITFRLDYTF